MANYRVVIQPKDQLGESSRQVVMASFGEQNFYTATPQKLEAAFRAEGWDAFDFKVVYDAGTLLITFRANVNTAFSDIQIENNATAILNGWYYGRQLREFSLVPIPNANTAPLPKTTNPKPATIKPSNSGNTQSVLPDVSGIFDSIPSSLATGLGVSTPIAIAGLLVLAVVVLKK